jgi:inosine-uridine nucleoside N-ribohydrolase
MKVLLDTDIGNDIDDALTLAYLIAHPECELLGITTVTAGAADRARLASALCLAYGARPPIRAGADRPLAREPLQEPPFDAASLLSRWPHEFAEGDAVDFLLRSIVDSPGEVTLVTIGALTNVAQLFQAHPEVAPQLGSLVLMGGCYFTREHRPEWNIRNDPEAATVVFAADVPHLRAVGLDVTRQVSITPHEYRERFSGALLDFAGPWLARRDAVTFHDPLAAATVFDPTLCEYERAAIRVDAGGWTDLVAGEHEVARSVSPQRFFAHYFEVIGSNPSLGATPI